MTDIELGRGLMYHVVAEDIEETNQRCTLEKSWLHEDELGDIEPYIMQFTGWYLDTHHGIHRFALVKGMEGDWGCVHKIHKSLVKACTPAPVPQDPPS